MYHYCHFDGRQDSFLCPKGTVFNQDVLVCDWWYNAACYGGGGDILKRRTGGGGEDVTSSSVEEESGVSVGGCACMSGRDVGCGKYAVVLATDFVVPYGITLKSLPIVQGLHYWPVQEL